MAKYCPEVLEKAEHYLRNYMEFDDAIPSVSGMAAELKISRRSFERWRIAEDDEGNLKMPEWAEFMDRLLATQERVLWNKGLQGDYNSNLVKLALAKHGYHDKVDNTLGNPDGGPLEIKSVTRTIVS